MMEYNQIAKQAIDFQKNAFKSWLQCRDHGTGPGRRGSGNDDEPDQPGTRRWSSGD